MSDEQTDDEFLDQYTRWPSPSLVAARRVAKREQMELWGEQEHRLQTVLEKDMVGFERDLMGLEALYQKQITKANERDRRLKEQREEIARLTILVEEMREKIKTGLGVIPGAPDAAEERLLDMMDRMRKEREEQESKP